jgi:DNA-binding NarL/FixJ family response regulator
MSTVQRNGAQNTPEFTQSLNGEAQRFRAFKTRNKFETSATMMRRPSTSPFAPIDSCVEKIMKNQGLAELSESTPQSKPQPTSPSLSKLRVLLVDDHPITRQGMRALINQQLNLEVCGEADSAPEAIALLAKLAPDLAIVDVSLKSTNGIELTKNMKAQAPNLPILVVSMHDELLYAERALRAGAMGYVMKQEAGDKVALAIQHLLRGEIYLSPKMKEKMLHRFVNKKNDQLVFSIDTLSDREMEVFQLIGNGFSTRQIAQKLNLSSKTIDSYREHLKLKLGLETGAELVRHAIQWARTEATL